MNTTAKETEKLNPLVDVKEKLNQDQRNSLYQNRVNGYKFIRQAWRDLITTQLAAAGIIRGKKNEHSKNRKN